MKIISTKGINKKVFENKTLLSGRYFDLIKKNALKHNPGIEVIMSICIGLDLGGQVSERLLESAGHTLNAALPSHLVYKKFLHSFRGQSVYDCNEFLRALDLPALSKREYVGV